MEGMLSWTEATAGYSLGVVTQGIAFIQGESALDLAKQRKNVWMINHLQEARQAKGYDNPSFLRKLKADKVNPLFADFQ